MADGMTDKARVDELVAGLRQGRLVRPAEKGLTVMIEGEPYEMWTGEVREMSHPDALAAADTIEAQAARIQSLTAALEPFALAIKDDVPGYRIIGTVAWTADQHRAARSALNPEG